MENSNQQNQITVLTATGKVGSQLIKFFSDAAIACNAVTRNNSNANKLPFIHWMEGDLNNKANLQSILSGTKKLFLNSGVIENMVEVQNNIIDVAKSAGVEHIVKLSTPNATPGSKDSVGQFHWQIEEHLKNSGMNWNILQPQSFMQNWLGDMAKTIRAERKIYAVAGDGKRAFTDTRDIAEVAFTLFTNPKDNNNKTFPLSGPGLVSFYDVADAISKSVGEKVNYISQSPEEATERMRKIGTPEFMIQLSIIIETNQKLGVAEKLISNNAAEILGKKGRNIYDFAKDYSTIFK